MQSRVENAPEEAQRSPGTDLKLAQPPAFRSALQRLRRPPSAERKVPLPAAEIAVPDKGADSSQAGAAHTAGLGQIPPHLAAKVEPSAALASMRGTTAAAATVKDHAAKNASLLAAVRLAAAASGKDGADVATGSSSPVIFSLKFCRSPF